MATTTSAPITTALRRRLASGSAGGTGDTQATGGIADTQGTGGTGDAQCEGREAAALDGPPVLDDLPVLDEVPLLGAALELARRADRTVAGLCDALIQLQDADVAETTTGIALEQWLALAGRRTRSDRQMLLTACDALRRLPALRAAFLTTGQVSWCQVRAVALAVERLPRHLDDLIDGELSRTIEATSDGEPDGLVTAVSRAAHSAEPVHQQREQRAIDRAEFLALQPRLDGSGGRVFGDFGPLSFATLDAALAPTRDPRSDEADRASGRGDEPRVVGSERHGLVGRDLGRERARRLLELCDRALAGDHAATSAQQPAPRAGREAASEPAQGAGSMRSRPQLLLRLDLATLLDRDQMPGELLTHLTGGKLWLDAATARQLIESRGADLRSIVVDDCGNVVGVGRRTRVVPGWLTDATLALHDTCTHPGCLQPARRCESDHAVPWHPTGPDRVRGRTDIDQLAPLCRYHNHRKEPDGWRTLQQADGRRRWSHRRSGLTTTTHPATWRPPDPRPPPGG